MAPPRSTTGGPRGSAASTSKAAKTASSRPPKTSRPDKDVTDPFADDEPPRRQRRDNNMDVDREADTTAERIEDDEDEDAKRTIPPELLTRILHEFFEKDGTRISKDANKAVAKYMDIFVREAIARTAVEKGSGFLEVEDLEKVAPQLLMDL
ncbi:CENP-S associating centromere protein X-domain-containing protein [Xylaria flabelliformis]|nr:CENP-S associating centromere protein X-domain-containing protein [Xylaria flabelliformis]